MKKILIVEDDRDILQFLTFRLKKVGFDVTSTRTGDRVLTLVREVKPDLIVLDITLPKLNGYEVFRQIREDQTSINTPVILSTASTHTDVMERTASLQANDYILKPFEANELIQKIKKFI